MKLSDNLFEGYKEFHENNFSGKSNISPEDKIKIVGASPEIITAVKFLTSLFVDVKAKEFISMDFDFLDEKFELTFRKKDKIIFDSAQESKEEWEEASQHDIDLNK